MRPGVFFIVAFMLPAVCFSSPRPNLDDETAKVMTDTADYLIAACQGSSQAEDQESFYLSDQACKRRDEMFLVLKHHGWVFTNAHTWKRLN